ncbi:site-specific DNA-methyltransferase [Azospirillum sp. HJ39]|uniref:DNA-methyltransferase n=1 Tax=Azospirillum sp. HJ39 TaxID=3159496 RepID=UPI0035561AE6
MTIQILTGDCRAMMQTLDAESVQCCVTSPPYFNLRDYGVDGQIGLEPTPEAFVAALVEVFREVRRVLRPDGTVWLNLGDSYVTNPGNGRSSDERAGLGNGGGRPHRSAADKSGCGLKPKDLLMIPARVALALQADGWWLRSDTIWHKPNPMPESVTDRPTSAHEHIFLLAKSERYFYDADAIREAESVPDWDDGSRVFGGVNKHGANAQHGDRTTGRRATSRKRGLPPRHAQYPESSDQSGLDAVPRGVGRNARNVWTIPTKPFPEAHFATFPPELAERCIKAGSKTGDTVLDPFGGAGTTGLVADRLGRHAVLCELNPDYVALAERRIRRDAPLLADTRVTA